MLKSDYSIIRTALRFKTIAQYFPELLNIFTTMADKYKAWSLDQMHRSHILYVSEFLDLVKFPLIGSFGIEQL